MSTGTMASYEVIILKEGYCNSDPGASQMKACGTATLLKGPQNIVVDTGNPWDKDLILQRLSENGVSTDDVGYVVCSHGHSDHVGNLNLFPRAIVIVSYDICHGDQYLLHDFEQGIPYEIDEHVEVIATPGHTGADVSVVVKNTAHGTVVLAGDLFECKEDLDEPHIWQQSSENPEIQQHSRLEVLKIADYIVPGHGEMFKVPAKHKSQLSAVLIYEEFSRHDSTSSSVQKAVSYHVFEAE